MAEDEPDAPPPQALRSATGGVRPLGILGAIGACGAGLLLVAVGSAGVAVDGYGRPDPPPVLVIPPPPAEAAPTPTPMPTPRTTADPTRGSGLRKVDGVTLTDAEAARMLHLVNTATSDRLREIGVYGQGVGVILRERPFASIEAFGAARGIGAKTVQALEAYVDEADGP